MYQELKKLIKESLQDNATGRYSHARLIALVVAVAATVFMWKLIITGGMTIEYFVAYLSYGTGFQTLNKFLDNRDSARIEQAKENIKAPDEPKPPKSD